MIDLWRNKPDKFTLKKSNHSIPLKFIFPSGRLAITLCLAESKFKRNDRVAIPEWSSNCLLKSVSKIATPIPMTEVIKYKINVKGVIIYDQWGWATSRNFLEEIENFFPDRIIIHDVVDTTDLFDKKYQKIQKKYLKFKKYYRVFSLSKTLGLDYGGLLLENNRYKDFKKLQSEYFINNNINPNRIKIDNLNLLTEVTKSESSILPPSLKKWVNSNNIILAMQKEHLARKENINLFKKSNLTKDWHEWMLSSLKISGVPGIVPLFRNYDINLLKLLQNKLLKKFNILTQLYHFNWSGNPINTKYNLCLAFPIHSEVPNIQEKIDFLETYL